MIELPFRNVFEVAAQAMLVMRILPASELSYQNPL